MPVSGKKDYYEILGVPRNAKPDEIKTAYRQQALKYHPDRNPGDKEAEANFKTASEAYGVLSDEKKRAAYDQFGHEGLDANFGGGGGFGGFQDISDIFGSFGDIFVDLFGMPGGGRRAAIRSRTAWDAVTALARRISSLRGEPSRLSGGIQSTGPPSVDDSTESMLHSGPVSASMLKHSP